LSIFFVNRSEIIGKWNDKGRVVEHKLKNFKKYLSNMTLMKERHLGSIVILGEVLTYATTF